MSDLVTNILIKVLDAFTGPLKKLDTGLHDVEKTAEQVEKRMKFAADLNQAAEAAGRFGNALLGPIKSSVMAFANFEAAMSKVSALTGEKKGGAGFEALKQSALELGAATKFSAEEVALLQQEYAQAGFKTAEILNITKQTLSAAAASGLDLGRTAEIVGGTIRSMGLDVSQTGRAIDILTKAASESNSNMSDMAEAMSYAGPVARSAGMSLEQTAGMIAALSNEMVKGSRAGTGLSSMINQIVGIKQGDAQAKAFARIGLSYERVVELQKLVATGRLQDALASIGQAVGKLPNDKRMKALENIFGKDLATSSNILINASMNTSETGLTAITASLSKLDDDTNKMADTMQDNLLGSFERAEGAVTGLATAAGEALAPTAKKAAEALEGISGWATDFVKQYPTFSKATMELTAGMGGLGLVMQGGLTAVSTYQSATAGLIKSYDTMKQSLGGQFGLVALAGAAGVLVGTWANETLELDKAIATLAGRKTPQKANKDSPVQTFAGGWEINMRTGEVVKMGKGDGPAMVRRARAKGATTQAELSGVIGQEVTSQINTPMAERVEEEKRKHMGTFSPLLEAPKKVRPMVMLPETPKESAAAAATKEQTEKLLAELKEQAKQQKRIADGMERLRFLQPGGVRPTVTP